MIRTVQEEDASDPAPTRGSPFGHHLVTNMTRSIRTERSLGCSTAETRHPVGYDERLGRARDNLSARNGAARPCFLVFFNSPAPWQSRGAHRGCSRYRAFADVNDFFGFSLRRPLDCLFFLTLKPSSHLTRASVQAAPAKHPGRTFYSGLHRYISTLAFQSSSRKTRYSPLNSLRAVKHSRMS